MKCLSSLSKFSFKKFTLKSAIIFIPVIGLTQIILNQQLQGAGAEEERKGFENCQITVTEATKNIRTVTSLQCGNRLLNDFCVQLAQPVKSQCQKAVKIGGRGLLI